MLATLKALALQDAIVAAIYNSKTRNHTVSGRVVEMRLEKQRWHLHEVERMQADRTCSQSLTALVRTTIGEDMELPRELGNRRNAERRQTE